LLAASCQHLDFVIVFIGMLPDQKVLPMSLHRRRRLLPHSVCPLLSCIRLQTLNEYIQDTEDLVNLKLDQHRNQLIGIDLILTAFTSSVAIMTAVAGYFGMNLHSGLEENPLMFRTVAAVATCAAFVMFVLFVGWLWLKQMLVF
jgi:hypothetical protein